MNLPLVQLPDGAEQRIDTDRTRREPIGTVGNNFRGETFRYVRIVNPVDVGDLITEKVTEYKIKSVKVKDSEDPSVLAVTINVPASTVLFEEGEVAEFTDGTNTDIQNIIFTVIANQRCENTGTSAADITVDITVKALAEFDEDQTRQFVLPPSYSQSTNNAASLFLKPGLNGRTNDLNSAAGTNSTWVVRGVALAKVATATSTNPKYMWVKTGGIAVVDASAAVDAGVLLVANVAASNAGKVLEMASGGQVRYAVGQALETTTAAGLVRINLDIG